MKYTEADWIHKMGLMPSLTHTGVLMITQFGYVADELTVIRGILLGGKNAGVLMPSVLFDLKKIGVLMNGVRTEEVELAWEGLIRNRTILPVQWKSELGKHHFKTIGLDQQQSTMINQIPMVADLGDDSIIIQIERYNLLLKLAELYRHENGFSYQLPEPIGGE